MTRDLTVIEDIENATADFRRAELAGDAALASWAREYGYEACKALAELRDRADPEDDD